MSLQARKIRLIMALRRGGISDTRVLSAIEQTPREAFLPDTFADQAYDNVALPIACGQTISQPLVVALMTQALEVEERSKVLEIGTGSGYQAAVLARLVSRVYTVECHRELLREAQRCFQRLGLSNVVTRLGDGSAGWPEQAPFDRILCTAAANEIPQKLLAQLAPGGVFVLPVGPRDGSQRLLRVRNDSGGPVAEDLGEVRFVPLVACPTGGA